MAPLNVPFWLFRKMARQQGINPIEISGFDFTLRRCDAEPLNVVTHVRARVKFDGRQFPAVGC